MPFRSPQSPRPESNPALTRNPGRDRPNAISRGQLRERRQQALARGGVQAGFGKGDQRIERRRRDLRGRARHRPRPVHAAEFYQPVAGVDVILWRDFNRLSDLSKGASRKLSACSL
jgi:hypothetical protein